MSKLGSAVLTALGVALLYVACAKLGLALAFRAAQVTAVWPPTAFAIFAVLRLGRRAVPGVLLGAFLANATAAEPLFVAAGIAAGNTLEALTGAWLLRGATFDGRLARVRDVLALLGALALSPVVAATIGVASLTIGGVHPMSSAPGLWWLWWLGDALGGLIFAPLLFVWSDRDRLPHHRGALVEGSLLIGGLVVASTFVFFRAPEVMAAEYVIFPFLIWAALRFGPTGSATATVLANAVAIWGTHTGTGPFAGAGPEQGLVLLQVFMAVAATTSLFLGAVAAQNRSSQQRKDEFLAMLAHELRNPLAPILHATSLIDPETSESAEALQVIRRQTRTLARLVDDLLDVSRITSGKVHLVRRRVVLSEIVHAAADTWRHFITQKKQELSVDVAPHAIWLDADSTRITQTIANLVHNAAKFTPSGGRIAVTANEENGMAVVRVRDDGQGMNGEMLAHAFEAFVQGPPPLDRPQGGLGLGLTLVRRLVELHDGSVEARSGGDGHGSEFVIRLPSVAPPAPAAAAEAGGPTLQEHRARRVLLVEDHADARHILALMLKRDGHDVRVAGDGPSALIEAQRFAPEIVLLDIGLPGMDGYAVAKQLRALPALSRVRLIALTGYGQPEDREQSRAAGFDEHLLKPVEASNLLAMLQD